MPDGFRGVVRCGVFECDGELALVVGHPHPNSDYGGGPGPTMSWREPYDASAYVEDVDVDADDYGDGFDPSDVPIEIDAFSHVAFGEGDSWTLSEVPASGTIEDLRLVDDDTTAALVTYGGAAFYVWYRSKATGAESAYELTALPKGLVEPKGALLGRGLLVAGSRDFGANTPSEVGLLELRDAKMTWVRDLRATPGRVVALDACYADDGSIIAYAGGEALWHLVDDEWQAVHSIASGTIALVHCEASGEVIAGTSTGDVIAGFGASCRTIARVGPIHTAIRYGDAIYFADRDRVYRVVDGEASFEICFTPKIGSAGSWSSTGRLAVGRGKLWLAGSHSVVWTTDGREWTELPLTSSNG